MATRSRVDLRLRDVFESDLPTLYEHQADPESARMAAFPSRTHEAFTIHWTKLLADANVDKKAILLRGRLVGSVVGFDRFGKREVGYWIAREHWGQGIASWALSAYLAGTKTRPLHARVSLQNVASLRILEKCGFKVTREAGGPAPVPDDGIEELVLELVGPR